MSERNDLKELAAQLHCPSGEAGIAAGDRMFRTNGNMIRKTIDSMEILPCDRILEIGFGNGKHLGTLYKKEPMVTYYGVDTSDLMVDRAHTNNISHVRDEMAFFRQTDGIRLPYDNAFFDIAFTVNTIYFWEHPEIQLCEVYRVLAPGRSFYCAWVDRISMEALPFVDERFTLYGIAEAERLFRAHGFTVITSCAFEEEVRSNAGNEHKRKYWIIKARKAAL
ncbi:class I SAM-dependent methyltransferase [Sinomicrobium pectinilyticum]|uniref:Class I SAM-dependent methyltransferase n=1 Tax=Sinomicrobium pectinilyticum TaxID=1084421 RepID=A0A3N0E367_SINP1|nr:class I SAM-dependent methyltransferase [Sinomicrobium pectinilyticum]RNL82277.1 class I SAM-dependent methyltransferase [Sinomicrobium pectinilyticum]